MAEEGVKISELTDLPQPTGEEYIPVEVGGQNKKVKLGKLLQSISDTEIPQGLTGYIDNEGKRVPDYPGYSISNPIHLEKGDKIIFNVKAYDISYLAEDMGDGTYSVIKKGNILKEESYLATKDINVVISFTIAKPHVFRIQKNYFGGPNRKLYEAAGAKFNEETGFYELNGLTDITEEEMADIYQYSTNYIGFGAFDGCKARTLKIFPTALICDSGPSLHTTFRGCTLLEVLVFHKTYDIVPSNLSSTFKWCAKLNSIIGVINLTNINKYSLLYESFVGCQKLVNIKIKLLKANIGFKDSPLLSKESLQYMVENSAATSPITITLHADVYAKVASAEAEWGDIFTLSQSKNISFVQA